MSTRTAWIEFWTGLSGDMFVGALLDAGWSETSLRAGVEALGLGALGIEVVRRRHRGLTGLGITVTAPGEDKARHFTEIAALIEGASLPERPRRRAIEVFRLLGEAEARIHGIPLERVHFHEIGAVDSIVDIVAVCLAVEELGIGELFAGAVPIGRGFVSMDHGRLPVPAPAASLLLAGWPIRMVEDEGEFLTPTAAALLRVLARPRSTMPSMRVEAVGFGAGTREHPSHPNLVRIWIGERTESAGLRAWETADAGVAGPPVGELSGPGPEAGAAVSIPRLDRVSVLGTQVDDMDPRYLALLADQLLGAGALDVSRTAVSMKKGRLGTRLEVICRPDDAFRMARMILAESTTLGVRVREEGRWELPRQEEQVTTSLGPVRVKRVGRERGDRLVLEFDEVVRLAEAAGRPVEEIRALLSRELDLS